MNYRKQEEQRKNRQQMPQDRCDYPEMIWNASQNKVHSDTGQIFQWGIAIVIVGFMN